jgi:hypothetical protein
MWLRWLLALLIFDPEERSDLFLHNAGRTRTTRRYVPEHGNIQEMS